MLEPLLAIYFERSIDVLLTAGGTAIERFSREPLGETSAEFQAMIIFSGPSYLHVYMEVLIRDDLPLLVDYSFHYMTADNATIFRYDNIGRHPGLPHEPHHKHEGADERVIGCPQPSISTIRDEIAAHLKGSN